MDKFLEKHLLNKNTKKKKKLTKTQKEIRNLNKSIPITINESIFQNFPTTKFPDTNGFHQ